MNIREVAVTELGGYIVVENNLVMKKCPFCNNEDYNFEFNTQTGNAVCLSCNHITNLNELAEKLEIEKIKNEKKLNSIIFNKESYKSRLGVYKNLQRETIDKVSKACSESVLERENVIITKEGTLSFIHLDANRKVKAWRNFAKDGENYISDCLNSLWNCDSVQEKEIIITTSELEALALIDKGITNVVAIANPENLYFIEEFYDYINSKEKIVLVANQKILSSIEMDFTHRIGIHKSFIVPLICENVIEELSKTGSELIDKLRDMANFDLSIKNVKDITEIEGNKYDHVVVGSGEKYIDALLGGIRMGEVTIVTGFPGSGKSTILNQCIISFREENERTFVFSGEFKTSILKKKLYEIAAGKPNLEAIDNKYNPNIKDRKIKSDKAVEQINEWIKGYVQIFEYDVTANDRDLLTAIEEEYRKKGTRIFFIDNIMTVGLTLDNGDTQYVAQKNFMIRIKDLTKKYPIHIFLVAHPKKVNEADIDMFSIHGASEIANLSDNIIFIRRLNEKEVAELKSKGKIASAEMKLLKDRYYGRIGTRGLLDYDKHAGRIFVSGGSSEKVYGWVRYA